MTFQILLNVSIAFVWMLLHDVWDPQTFAVGYAVALVFIFLLRRYFSAPFYGRKVWAIVKLLYIFNIELVKSSLMVIGQITAPKLLIKPGIIRMETVLKSDWEITILSALITLTPGSVVFEVAPREGVLYIHAIDVPETRGTLEKMKMRFEKAISEVMN